MKTQEKVSIANGSSPSRKTLIPIPNLSMYGLDFSVGELKGNCGKNWEDRDWKRRK